MKTILGIGAHYDDCVFGIPGILLKAVRKNYRVVVLSLIGDYRNWKPAQGRERELVEETKRLAQEHGVEARFLPFAEMKLESTEENKRIVAEAIAQIGADIAFTLWPHDQHPDHESAAVLCKTALRYADRLIGLDRPFKAPPRVYYYDNGPRHTIGFEPNVFVDVTDEWRQASGWLGKLMAMVRKQPYDPGQLDGATQAKETLARYRGQTCGVAYAEALRSLNAYPHELL